MATVTFAFINEFTQLCRMCFPSIVSFLGEKKKNKTWIRWIKAVFVIILDGGQWKILTTSWCLYSHHHWLCWISIHLYLEMIHILTKKKIHLCERHNHFLGSYILREKRMNYDRLLQTRNPFGQRSCLLYHESLKLQFVCMT